MYRDLSVRTLYLQHQEVLKINAALVAKKVIEAGNVSADLVLSLLNILALLFTTNHSLFLHWYVFYMYKTRNISVQFHL